MNACRTTILFVSMLTLSGCDYRTKFNEEEWKFEGDGFTPYRQDMLSDLVMNHRLVGLTYSELITLLGPTPPGDEGGIVSYQVSIHYAGIDPDYGVYLRFTYTRDSVITSCKIDDWHK